MAKRRRVKLQTRAFANTEEDDYQEPEAAVLLIACGIGLLTGGSVVLFNYCIHEIQHLAWGEILSSGGRWARELPKADIWPLLVVPPTAGGAAVGLLRFISGGFDPPAVTALISQSAGQDSGVGDGGAAADVGRPPVTAGAAPAVTVYDDRLVSNTLASSSGTTPAP
jgi:hypothetical protein